MSANQMQGRVSKVSEVGIEVQLNHPDKDIFVRFDNFAGEQHPPVGAVVLVYWAGWRFGHTPGPLWSLVPPAVVEVLGVQLYGFRLGRKRHLKFLVHEVGLDKQSFADKPAKQTGKHPLSAAARRLQEAAKDTGCPAAVYGQAACNGEPGVSGCGRREFWEFDRLLAGPSRGYEAAALGAAESSESLACLMIGSPVAPALSTTEEEIDGLHDAPQQALHFLLVASHRHGIFVTAAAPTSTELRYSLLTAFIPDQGSPVSKLLRMLERAEHISRVQGGASSRNLANLLEVKAAILATRRTGVLRAPGVETPRKRNEDGS